MTPEQKKSVGQLSRAFFLQVVGNCLLIGARPSLILSLDSDPAAAAALIGSMGTMGAILEFLCGPAFGRFSDRYGRVPFLMLGPLGSTVMNGLVYFFPTRNVLIVDKVITGLTVTSFVTILRGSLNDVVQGQAFAVANSSMAMWTGSAIIIAPMIASRFLSDRMAFAAASATAIINGVQLLCTFKETLPQKERRPIDWGKTNPLSFTKLFTHSRSMTLLVFAIFFQSLGEIRFAFDLAQVIWRHVPSP